MPPNSVPDNFERIISAPLLDHMNPELFNRFNEISILPYYGLAIFPSKLSQLQKDIIKWKDGFLKFVDLYVSDLPNPTALNNEVNSWQIYWDTYTECFPDNITET